MPNNYLGLQPPCGSNGHSLGGPHTVEPEAVLTIPDSPAQYAINPLVLTICGLVSDSRGSWAGTAEELLQAAGLEGCLIGVTPQQIDHAVEDLKYLLFEFDQIQHFMLEIDHNKPIRHVFLLRE